MNTLKQKKFAETVQKLEVELSELEKEQYASGWAQRNAVISHVYSNYQQSEEVIKSKNRWEEVSLKCNVLKGLLNICFDYRDIYGLYELEPIKMEVEELIKLAEVKEKYEIASLFKKVTELLFKS